MNRRGSIYICYFMNLLAAACITMIGPMLPQISSDFSLELSGTGALMAFQFAGFTIFTLAAGVLSDRVGKKPVAAGALIMLLLSCFLLSVIRSFGALCVVLMFLGGGMGILEVLSNALLKDIVPENSVFQLNFLQVFFGLGAIISPILIGVAFSNSMSWRTVYQITGGVVAIYTILFVLNKMPASKKTDRVSMHGVRELILDKKFLLICLCMFLYTGSESSAWGWMSTYTETVLQFSVFEASMAVAVFWFAVTVVRLIIALFINKLDIGKLLIYLSAGSGITCVIMGFSEQTVTTWIMIALLGTCCSSQWGLILSYGTQIYQRFSGTVIALFTASGSVGMTAVPYIMGLVGDYSGNMRYSLAVPAIMFVLIAVVFLAFRTNRQT